MLRVHDTLVVAEYDQFEFEEDISEALSEALGRDFPNLITDAGLDLELIDIEFDP